MSMRVLVTDGMDASAIEKLRNDGHEVVEQFYEPDALGAALREFDAVIIRSATKIKEPQIDAAKGSRLKLIVRAGVGVDNIAVKYAEEAGITVNYSNGLTTLEFNEDKFRAALNNDPDKVRDAFTSSVESGAKSNGLMQALKQPLDIYGKTEGGKGVLVEKAGSPLAPSTMYNNTIQKELNNIDSEIERWQDKMENQIDHYTSQFSRLEQLIQQMNSQSSYFSQLMAGG